MRLLFTKPDQLFWLALPIIIVFLFIYYRRFYAKKRLRPLFLIRVFLFFLFLLIYLNPILTITQSENRDLKWNIYIDNSLSMSYHSNLSSNSLSSGIDDIIDRLEKKKIPLDIYNFGSKIDTNWNNGEDLFNESSTNIGQVLNHVEQDINKDLAGSIIITDGQANQGFDVLAPTLNTIKPIHIIGVGDKNPLVDIAITSIDAPPVIIKGENIEIEVLVSSYGIINKRVNVTINSKEKLLGSKILNLSGNGSIDKIRFLINPDETGEIEYTVQVNALPDEVNIANNKQIIPIQVLRDEYKIAIITGAPNFNTGLLKNILKRNKKFEIDHYFLTKNGYSKPLKIFWDTRYDLILFDNHPVNDNFNDWVSFLRIFIKKIISNQTSIGFFNGFDIHKETIQKYLSLVDVELNKPLIELNNEFDWSMNKILRFL